MENNLHSDQSAPIVSSDNSASVSITKQKYNPLRDILIGLISLFFGIILGIFLSRFIPLAKTSQNTITTPTINPQPTVTKHYILKDGFSSIDYPADWTLTDNTEEMKNPYTDVMEWVQNVSLVKGDYSITSHFTSEPRGCNFSDTPKEYIDETGGEYDNFINFIVAGNKYRRSKITTQENSILWNICSDYSYKYKDTYTSFAGFGFVAYGTPIQFDEKILTEMDEIMASMRTIK